MFTSIINQTVDLCKKWSFWRKNLNAWLNALHLKNFLLQHQSFEELDCCELLDILVSDCLLFKNASRDSSGTVIVNLEESFWETFNILTLNHEKFATGIYYSEKLNDYDMNSFRCEWTAVYSFFIWTPRQTNNYPSRWKLLFKKNCYIFQEILSVCHQICENFIPQHLKYPGDTFRKHAIIETLKKHTRVVV